MQFVVLKRMKEMEVEGWGEKYPKEQVQEADNSLLQAICVFSPFSTFSIGIFTVPLRDRQGIKKYYACTWLSNYKLAIVRQG